MTVTFDMPEGDAFLAALANVQAYASQRPKTRILLAGAAAKYPELIEGFEIAPMNGMAVSVDLADIRFRFDPEVALRLAKPTNRHMTDMFGIMLGTLPETIFPKLPIPGPPRFECQWLVASSNARIVEMVASDTSDYRLWMGAPTTIPDFFLKDVQGFRGIIGEPSMTTFIGATYDRFVVELYPDTYHSGWLSKFGRAPYFQVRGIETLARTFEVACQLMG